MSKNANINKKINKTNENQLKNSEKYFYGEDEDIVIVDFVTRDFEDRKNERKPYDLAWELNINFLLGNQFSYISEKGEIDKFPKQFYWQGEEVYNHIAPIVETRLAKLAKIRPTFSVKPTSNEERDLFCAKLSKNILDVFSAKQKLSSVIQKVTSWSEICGTGFYKIVWDSSIGEFVGSIDENAVMMGDVSICACSPFEIFPDSNASTDFLSMHSVIHARPVPATFIEEKYNIKIQGTDIDTFSFDQATSGLVYSGKSNAFKVSRQVKHDHVLLLERYEKPTRKFPNGKLTIVAGNHLLFDGDLPFKIGENQKREFPFVRQVSLQQVGSFWGSSVVERCIPIQKAYNTLKNRKHEFMARLASGVLAIEDGSVDIDLIEEEGIAPGKIIVYRNGSTPPRFIDPGSVPNDFDAEEDRLLSEFITISGVSELMRDSVVPSSVTSGTALSLLIEQDETRLSVPAENIRDAIKTIGEMAIRLYKQFASTKRLLKITDENGDIETYYWNNADVSYEEIMLESINELTQSPAQRKALLFDLYKAGIFAGSDGRMDERTKAKIIEALGFNDFETVEDISSLHTKKAIEENLKLTSEEIFPSDYDEHDIHILEHTKYLLSKDSKKDKLHAEKIQNHILEHKVLKFAGNKSQTESIN